MQSLLVFANQNAGALSRECAATPMAEYARRVGLEAEIVPTRSPAELVRLLRERVVGKVERVAIAGGDGTIHTAVQVLAKTGVALGILPQGTANNFATALRLPLDLPSAFRVIAEGEARSVSLGDAEGEYFTEAAGVGLFADALAHYGGGRPTKSLLRTLVTLIRIWLANRPHRLMLVVDGEPYVEQVVMVTIAYSFRLGPALAMAPAARVTDEHLDIVLLGPLTRGEMVAYYRAIRAQTHTELPKVQTLTGRQITIGSRRPLNVHVDDRARKRTPITVRIAPGALRVLVDRL
jgi:diacylglycerol kinase family enzyme